MIEGSEPPANTVILPGTELIIRRSTGPVGHKQILDFQTTQRN
jgi:hypothetical protein